MNAAARGTGGLAAGAGASSRARTPSADAERGQPAVENTHTAHTGAGAPAGGREALVSPVSAGLGVQERDEVLHRATALVVLGLLGGGAAREELDGGERLDLHVFNLEKFEKLFNAS